MDGFCRKTELPWGVSYSSDPTVDKPNPERARWFVDEVHKHDSTLRSYLKKSFPAQRDVEDVVQESYVRIWKSRARQPIENAKAFLFCVARRLMLDRVRRAKINRVDYVGEMAEIDVLDTGRNAAEALSVNEKVEALGAAIARLPHRCREIIILHKIKGMSQKEIAAQLGISERTVETQCGRGIRRCEEYLKQQGISGFYVDGSK